MNIIIYNYNYDILKYLINRGLKIAEREIVHNGTKCDTICCKDTVWIKLDLKSLALTMSYQISVFFCLMNPPVRLIYSNIQYTSYINRLEPNKLRNAGHCYYWSRMFCPGREWLLLIQHETNRTNLIVSQVIIIVWSSLNISYIIIPISIHLFTGWSLLW